MAEFGALLEKVKRDENRSYGPTENIILLSSTWISRQVFYAVLGLRSKNIRFGEG